MSSTIGVSPVQANYPLVITVCLSLLGTTVLTWCFAVRVKAIESWRNLSYTRWLILLVYLDSYLFVTTTSILQVGVGVTANYGACEAVTFMCILFYCSSKVVIYLFLIERVHIVRGGTKTRKQDKLYWFNTLGLIPYCVIVILAIVFRYNALDDNGYCYVGLRRESSFPLLIYDLIINIYLTGQFLFPMLGLYSYRIAQNPRLRQVALRTLIGTIATLCSSIANISAVFALKGHEPAFICLACCTADVAFSAVVLHWVTSVHNEDGPGYTPKVCLFHTRGATNCCVWRTWAYARTGANDSATRRSTANPGIAFDDFKGVPGVDLPSTVTTEITGGPRHMTHAHDSKNEAEGASPKARKLLGWFRRASIEEPRRRSGIEEEDIGLSTVAAPPSRVSHSVETTTTGITVQYDIRRTVEESRSESSSQGDHDTITGIDPLDSDKHTVQ